MCASMLGLVSGAAYALALCPITNSYLDVVEVLSGAVSGFITGYFAGRIALSEIFF